METRELAFYALIILLGWLSYLVLAPFLPYLVLAILFAFLFHPLYRWLDKFLWSWLSALIVLVVVLLCIVAPSVYFAGTLIQESTNAYQLVQSSEMNLLDESSVAGLIKEWTGLNVESEVVELFQQGRRVIKAAIPALITQTGSFLLGLFIFFFVLYLALIDGSSWFRHAVHAMPIKERHKAFVMDRIERQTAALLYGQILTSIVIGAFVGYMLWLMSVPNPVFWGFLAVILGIIPVLGAFLVYIPAGAFLIWQGLWIHGIAVIVLCAAFQLIIDNIIRPKMMHHAAEIHPAIVVLGALGGISLMGFVGFFTGPLILSFFSTLVGLDK